MESAPLITEGAINELLDNGLVDSAEYWASLWICEKGIVPSELAKRYYMYGICLQRTGRFSQAKVQLSLCCDSQDSFETALNLATDPECSVSQSDILFHLYECEYESADEKESRPMLRSCIYIVVLESIDHCSWRESRRAIGLPKFSRRSPSFIGLATTTSRLIARLITRLAKATCLELLK